MATKKTSEGRGRQSTDVRQAAEDALQQLDWAIGYLHGIRKQEISQSSGQEPVAHP